MGGERQTCRNRDEGLRSRELGRAWMYDGGRSRDERGERRAKGGGTREAGMRRNESSKKGGGGTRQ